MIGETIGNFRVVSRLGRGGMGEVYLAEQLSIGTRVAVKVLHAQVSADSEHVKRFFNEARATQKIQHAGIVKIFDVGMLPSGNAYLVMEHLEGESLAERIHRMGRIDPPQIVNLGKQIASVLDACHRAGITHRDLKPDNIFIVPDVGNESGQRVKVLDFGIAKLSGTLASASPQTVGTMGTPAYMAPEQWGDASKVDHRADIYSLGCVTFEMACGRPPFVCTTIAEACGKHLSEVPPTASSLVPDLPVELDALLAGLLAKKPDDRPQSGMLVGRAFDRLLGFVGTLRMPPSNVVGANPYGETMASVAPVRGPSTLGTGATVKATVPPARPRRRRVWPYIVGGLVVAGGGAVAIAMFARGKTPDAPPPTTDAAWCQAASPPVLDGASTKPVLLRYHFSPGQTTEIATVLKQASDVTVSNVRTRSDVAISLEGTITWTAVDGEHYTGTLKLAAIGADIVGANGPPGSEQYETRHWRTDNTDPPPEGYEALRTVVDLPILLTIGGRGELVSSNLAQIQSHLTKATPELRDAFSRDDLLRTLFLRLPAEPVKPGDTWRAGDLVKKLATYGEQSAKLELRVAAISADGNQVLLEASPDLHVDLAGRVTVIAKKSALHMWSQFDLVRHQITATDLHACSKLTLDTDGGRTEVFTELAASYDHVGTAAAPVPPPPVAPVDAAVVATVARADAAVPEPPPPPIDAAIDAAVEEPPPPVADVPSSLAAPITAARDQFKACVSGAGGKVLLRVTIGSDGRVRSASATGLSGRENSCVAGVARTLKFERKRGSPSFSVTIPLVLETAGASAPSPSLPATTPKLLESLHAIDPDMLSCGDRFPDGSTQSWVDLTIGPDGTVTSAVAKAEPAALRECIEGAAKAHVFAPSERGKRVNFGFKVR